MDAPADPSVFAALLRFGGLNKKQRTQFSDLFNKFTYVSPQAQRRIMLTWLENCLASEDPKVRQVAEEAAVYLVERDESRKRK